MKEGSCITAEMRKDREGLNKTAHNYILTLEKTARDSKAKIEELNGTLNRVKLENNNLFTRVADGLEVNEHHRELNGKLQSRITEVEEDNRKLANQIEDQVHRARKAGM
jgi:DNA integrity scanning protein DisA with diadenylate cyclase activity